MSGTDPFPAGPRIDAYIARSDVEQNLAYLSAKLTESAGWVGICGPGGVGKTLLVRLLLRRHAGTFTPLYVPSAAISADELQRWIVALSEARAGEDALEIAARLSAAGRPLLLAIDEAQHASPELIAWIEGLCRGLGAVRAILAWTEYEGERAPAPLAHCPTRVFVEPLELAEVPGYVETQLARSGAAPELRAVLAGRTLERIALASGGNRRAIQRLADAELAAHAWRARTTPLRVAGGLLARATGSAPRAATGLCMAEERPNRWARWGPLWVALATLVLCVAAALYFSR